MLILEDLTFAHLVTSALSQQQYMRFLITFLIIHTLLMALHTAALSVTGSLAGLVITDVGLFMGPTLFQIKIRGLNIKFNLLPLGSYVTFDDQKRSGKKRVEDLHPLIRAFVGGSGSIALVVAGFVCLGFSAGLHHLVSGFGQVVLGALRPFAKGAHLWSLLYQFMNTSPLFVTFGLIATKEAAFNLLPLPLFNGGDIIINLISFVKRIPDSLIQKLNVVGFIPLIFIIVSWFVALCYFMSRP